MDALHALVIDDDPGISELIARILLKEDIQVVVAASAEEGLEQLPHFVFDLACLDHTLPGMEGLVLGEYLRRNNPDMQVALVTGEDPAALEELTRSQGIVLIPKPFEVSEILDLVSRLQRSRKATKKERELRLARRLKTQEVQDEAAVKKRIRGIGELLQLLAKDSWADAKIEKRIGSLLPAFKVHAVRLAAGPRRQFVPAPPLG